MINKKEEFTVTIGNEEKKIKVLNCFELGNGKSYAIYKIDGEEGVFTSSIIQTPDEVVFEDVTDEEMAAITELLKEANEKEV